MSARSRLVGKKHPGPIWGHPKQFFSMDRRNLNNVMFCLFSLVGQGPLFTWFGPAIVPVKANRAASRKMCTEKEVAQIAYKTCEGVPN